MEAKLILKNVAWKIHGCHMHGTKCVLDLTHLLHNNLLEEDTDVGDKESKNGMSS